MSIFGLQKSAKTKHFQKDRGLCQFFGCEKSAQLRLFENAWGSSVGFSPFFCSPGTTFLEGKGGNPTEKLAQMTTFFEEVGLDPSKQ